MNDHVEMTTKEHEQVEQRLRSALEARARASVPDRRLPPPIDWPDERSVRRTWLTPLAIAASVLVIAGGVAVATMHRTTQAPPATQTTSGTVSPTPSTSTSPTASTAPTAPTATPSPATSGPSATTPQGGTPATVGGATIVVPVGWSIRQDTGSGGSTPINDTWCIEPRGGATCPITFVRMDPTRNPLDSDAQGGLESNPQYCNPGTGYTEDTLASYRDLTISGRAAEYRQWHIVCKAGGAVIDVAQYTVVTPTAYALFSDKATPEVRDVMAGIAASATLPAATSPTRLYDHGIVRTVTPVAGGGWTITVDRVIVGWPNQSNTTYSYVLPAGVTVSGPPAVGGPVTVPAGELVGRTVRIHTDGQVITDAYVE